MVVILDEDNKYHIFLPSAFKILICFLTVALMFYFVFIEKDFMKALLLLNVLTNYRTMLSFLTDWNEEIIYQKKILNNEAHGINSTRVISRSVPVPVSVPMPVSKFTNILTSESKDYQEDLLDYIQGNDDEHGLYSEWWRNGYG